MATQYPEEFFTEMKDWSQRKLRLVFQYVDGFIKILGSTSGLVYYVDGFAGAGVYEDGSKGSPLLAAEHAAALMDSGKPYSLKCINVEENPEAFQNLQAATATYGQLVTNLPGTFVQQIDCVLSVLGQRPAVIFLDAFGVSDYGWAGMRKLLHRQAPTDLWIRFDHKTARRLDGFFDSQSSMAPRKFENLCDLYGVDDRACLHQRLAGSSPDERVMQAINFYLERLVGELRKARSNAYATAYSIRSLTGENKYYLVFAASHAKAAILASDIVYGAEEDYQQDLEEERLERTGQLSFFGPALSSGQDDRDERLVTKIQPEILGIGKGKEISRIDIHTRLCVNWFGRIKSAHVNRALKALIEKGDILSKTGPVSDDHTRFKFR